METKGTTNESNLPEKGAQGVNDESVKSEVNQEQPIESEEKTEEISDNAPEITTEVNIEETEVVDNKEESKEYETIDEKPEPSVGDESDNDSDSVEKEVVEDKVESTKQVFTPEDYTVLDRSALLAKLNMLVNSFAVEIIKDAVEDIKTQFYKRYKVDVAEARKEFIDNGGIPEDFKFIDEASEDTFKVLYGQYKVKRTELNNRLDVERGDNLKIKNRIIEDIGELINKEESINKTFNEFRDLQQRWREIGLVPQNSVKNLWENYNHTVEKFYDYININKELRDLDFKKNLELKIELCEKAEALLLMESVTKAFKVLQEYHHQWREIGPVPNDQRDNMWERFKAATTQINKKHQDYFEGLKEQQVVNLEHKTALCEKVEGILTEEIERPKGWEDKAKELIEIQKLWRTIGFAPKKDNNKIYKRFKTACDEFFAHKRDFYKETKEIQKNNLQLKLDLCVQAESLSESTEWKRTTEDYIKLQRNWKEIGPIPKKYSETVWKRFRTACDQFFNKKSEFFNTIDSRQEDNLKLKLELVEKIKSFEKGEDDKQSLKVLMDIQKEWTEIGYVPLNKKEEIQKQFRDAINEKFEELKIDNEERSKLNFKSKVDNWVSSKSRNKLYSERNKLSVKIKELQNEIALYENNIGFFSASKNAQSLLTDITQKIDKAKEHMKSLKQKLQMLDKAEDSL